MDLAIFLLVFGGIFFLLFKISNQLKEIIKTLDLTASKLYK